MLENVVPFISRASANILILRAARASHKVDQGNASGRVKQKVEKLNSRCCAYVLAEELRAFECVCSLDEGERREREILADVAELSAELRELEAIRVIAHDDYVRRAIAERAGRPHQADEPYDERIAKADIRNSRIGDITRSLRRKRRALSRISRERKKLAGELLRINNRNERLRERIG